MVKKFAHLQVVVSKRATKSRGNVTQHKVDVHNRRSGKKLSSFNEQGSRSAVIKNLRKKGYVV